MRRGSFFLIYVETLSLPLITKTEVSLSKYLRLRPLYVSRVLSDQGFVFESSLNRDKNLRF